MPSVDLLYILLLAIAMPVYGGISYRRYIALAKLGNEQPRPRLYLQTQALEWSLFAALVLLWLYHGRPAGMLGLQPAVGTGFWIAAGIAIAITAALVYQWYGARRLESAKRREQYESLGDLRFFLPRTAKDYRHFVALSLTAGFVEEIIYRGFLFWYLLPLMPLWAVILVSSVIFGLGHSYQGIAGMLRVFGVGIAFGILYALSDSIGRGDISAGMTANSSVDLKFSRLGKQPVTVIEQQTK